MGAKTAISWTTATWNPVHGCSRVSEGCRHCYAERLSLQYGYTRLPWTGPNAAQNVTLHPERLDQPRRWREPRRIFVNSMSDLFHEQIPDSFLRQIWDVMLETPHHTYQILTKRPARAVAWPGPWPPHLWLGVSVEDARVLWRVDRLRETGAAVKWISAEPLLGPLVPGLDLTGIDWVVVGGESGPDFRPMDHAWARAIRDLCVARGVAFFFKQDAARVTETRPWLDGEVWHQYPGRLDPPTPAPTSGGGSDGRPNGDRVGRPRAGACRRPGRARRAGPLRAWSPAPPPARPQGR